MTGPKLVAIPSDALATIYRLDGKVDSILERLAKAEQLEDRILAVERRQNMVAGAGILGGGVFSTIIALLGILPK